MTTTAIADRQRGTTLIVAMIILMVLTMLGVTALNTTTLEERMAANSQEVNRAFQAAEAGIDVAFDDSDAYSLTAAVDGKTAVLGDYQAGANYTVSYLRATNPPVGSLYSATSFSAFHFDIRSEAASRVTDPGGANALTLEDQAALVTLHGGTYQIGPKL